MKIRDYNGNIHTIRLPTTAPGGEGEYYMECPVCTPSRKHNHQKEKKMAVNMRKFPHPWRCNHCGEAGYVFTDEDMAHRKIKPLLTFPKDRAPEEKQYAWLKKRSISAATADHFKIRISNENVLQLKTKDPEKKGKWLNKVCVNFPYYEDGLLVNIKYRDNFKNFKLISGATKIFYNIDSIKNQKYAIITEGEPDCMAYHESGLTSVVSVPNGATISQKEKQHYEDTGQLKVFNPLNLEYLDLNIHLFDHLEVIYLATDDDATGIKLRGELARRLGKEKCKFIRFSDYKDDDDGPINDPNQLLMVKGKAILADTLNKAYEFPIENVSTAGDYMDEILSDFDHGRAKGKSTGFKSLDPHFSWMPSWLYMFNGYPNEGKALDVNTEIPTPYGFCKMKYLEAGDAVYDETGNACKIIHATKIMKDRPCYEVTFCDNSKIVCNEQHLWKVYSREARSSRNRHVRKKSRITSTTGLDQSHLMIQPEIVNTKHLYENQKSSDSNKNNFSVDNTIPVTGKEWNLSIHPYVLGLWLGDGHSASARLTCGDEDASEIMNYIENCEYEIKKSKSKYAYHIFNLHSDLRKKSLLNNKHIPQEYIIASMDQRLELLQGIMDSDGSIHPNGKCELSLSDEKLARDAHALISSLGIKVSFFKNKSFLNGVNKKDRFRMRFITSLLVFKLQRKAVNLRKDVHIRHSYRTITSVKKVESVPVKCIQVDSPNKLYLAGRSYIPTHNSTMLFNMMAVSTILYGDKWGIYSPENYPIKNIIDTLAEIFLDNTANIEFKGRIKKYDYKAVIEEHIQSHFFFVDSADGYTPRELLTMKEELVKKKGITGFFTDPWSALNHKEMGNTREDQYIAQCLNSEIRLASKYNLINIIAHHPPKPSEVKGPLLPPHPYQLSGGAMWWNKSHVIFCIHRINRTDYSDTKTGFHVQKVKEEKLFGEKTNRDKPVVFEYKRRSNRFLERVNASDPNSVYTRFPFKIWTTKKQLTFDDF